MKIFWSSEQTHLRYAKKKKEKEGQKKTEPKCPKIPNKGRHEILYKFPSQNATSRRQNFNAKRWDVYGSLEEEANDLSIVFHNEFIKRTKENREAKYFERGESSLKNGLSARKNKVPNRKTLRSEPSMVDLVECGDLEIEIEKIEDGDEDDEEEVQYKNKVIEWTEDDQKNIMNIGISEMERNKRLESLIARRKERKQSMIQHENNLVGKKLIAPVITTKGNALDYSNDFEDGLEIPSSAPSLMPRSPYGMLYDPSKEKPYYQKDVPFYRHESFSLGHLFPRETKQHHAYSRFRRPPDKGNHDWLIDRLIYNESGESEFQEPNNPIRKGEETTHQVEGHCKTNTTGIDDNNNNNHTSKSKTNQTSGLDLVLHLSKIETGRETHERILNLPVSATSATNTNTSVNEYIYDSITCIIDKRQENMFLADKRLCHTPTYSIASDLQVEVSEVGSPTSRVDENADTNSSIDSGSMVYDGDIDRNASSGSEDLWGTSFHGVREVDGARGEKNTIEENNSNDIISPNDEENVVDFSSLSTKSYMPEDTPTHAINNDHMKHFMGETEEPPQSSNSSHVLDQLPYDTNLLEKSEDLGSLQDNVINETQVINDVNNLATTEQDNIDTSISTEIPRTSIVRQESIDETSVYSVSSSPRSVLPEKTTTDEVASSTFDQHIDIDAQQSIMETFNNEVENPHDTLSQTIQPLTDDTNVESHNTDFNHFQVRILESNILPFNNLFIDLFVH
ncbi:hypothetical protein RJT34_12673 [Clitoria ternatea]|uniref:Uncharacterized protein n=1 Tax=Clitoria ternatea TaxID=43366 RepID=A0AAN9JPT8_CLITE